MEIDRKNMQTLIPEIVKELDKRMDSKLDELRNQVEGYFQQTTQQVSGIGSDFLRFQQISEKHMKDTKTYRENDEDFKKRALPIIIRSEENEIFKREAEKKGKVFLKIVGIVTAIGGAYLILKQIFHG